MSYSTAYNIVSGQLASGGISDIELGKGTFPTTIALTGNFSWSGVNAATSGIAIVSGAFTPSVTGKLLISANARFQGTPGGNTGSQVYVGVISGVGVAVSGLGTPPVQFLSITGPISGSTVADVNYNATIWLSGLTLSAAQNFALMMTPAGSGLVSGTGQLVIQEVIN